MKAPRITLLLVCAVLVLAGSGCSESVPEGVVQLRGAGATFPAPLYKAWFEKYNGLGRNVFVSYSSVGSGEGIRRFVGEDVDVSELVEFGASDAKMKDEEMAKVDRGAQPVPMTAGSIVLAYNLPNLDAELKLSREAYSKIFLGEITQWQDELIAKDNPGVELPDLEITLVARQDSSGTTYAFTNHLSSVNPQWKERFGPVKRIQWPPRTMLAHGNGGVAGRIQRSIGSIGYVQYGYAARAGMKMALLQNKAGQFVQPTDQSGVATLANADLSETLWPEFPDPDGEQSYPIVTMSWILLYKQYESADQAQAVRELFEWCLNEGQQHSNELGYIPLEPQLATDAAQLLANIGP
jgi:phosphate transport system substrate-binding protein